jgi:hypothetical protein
MHVAELDDFEDTAAVVSPSISSSQSTRCWSISLARSAADLDSVPYCPDWRWMLERQDSPGTRRRDCFVSAPGDWKV